MRGVFLAFLLLAGCASAGARSIEGDSWPALRDEAVALIARGGACGPVSLSVGFCRKDALEAPALRDAALSDSCRAQPVSYLAGFGVSAADMRDRRAVAEALAALFAAPPFDGPLAGLDDRRLLRTLHDRDQALRSFRPPASVSNPEIAENGKWVAICAHALLARRMVGRFLERTTPQALAADEELAGHAWLLVQHSDFDPAYQLRMSQWFGSSQAPHMKKHSAFLWDRAMVGLHKPQRYGTQLRCSEGVRETFPVEDEAGLDARRAALALAPIKEHIAAFSRPCPPPRPKS